MIRRLLPLSLLLLAACAGRVVPPARPAAEPPRQPHPVVVTPPPTPARPSLDRAPLPSIPATASPSRAADAGLRPGPVVAALRISPADAARALGAFRTSCGSV